MAGTLYGPWDLAYAGYPGTTLATALAANSARLSALEAAAASKANITDRRFDPARANRVIYIGDSITFGDSIAANPDYVGQRDFPAWAEKLSNAKIIRYRNAGLGGNDSVNLLAGLQATVLQYADRIGWCVVMCGTNDAYYANLGTAGYTFATYTANMAAVVASLRAAGIRPVLCTITPRDVASSPLGLRQNIEKYNAWLREWTAANGVPLVDFRRVLIDPATNQMKAEFAGDGLHPGDWANVAMGQVVADTLSSLFQPWHPPLADFEADAAANLVTGGLFLTDTDANGVGNGWELGYLLGVPTRPTPTDTTAIKGQWQRLTYQGNSSVYQAIAAGTASPKGWAVGDRMALCGWLEGDYPVGGGYGYPMIYFNGLATPLRPYGAVLTEQTAAKHVGPHIFYREFTIPAGTTSMDLWLTKYGGAATASGWVQFAQVTMLNLTRLGVVMP